MNPYSHLVLAAQLEAEIQPNDRSEYYWGAVAPDVRYTAGLRREQTHLDPATIVGFLEQYPHLEAFIQGYLVHRMTDLLDLQAFLTDRLLYRPIMRFSPMRFTYVLVETYYLAQMPISIPLSGQPNDLLRDLGINTEQARAFAEAVRPLALSPSFETAVACLRRLRQGKARVEQYIEAGQILERNRFLIPLLYRLANLKQLNQQLVMALRHDPILAQTVFKSKTREASTAK